MERVVCVDKFIATKKQDRYLYEFQFSSVSRSTLCWLTDYTEGTVAGAWLQTNGTYIVQCCFTYLPKELFEKIFNEIS